MGELCDLAAVELRRLIGAKEISPVELLRSCLDRIEETNPVLHAFPTLDPDGALAQARKAERAVLSGEPLERLHGLPIGIKDTSDTAGLRTTLGSLLHKNRVPDEDDPAVARVRAAGAIVLGKTNTPEFAAGGNTRNLLFGATGNPFDPALTAAGSSGGSAAALAAGMVPLATGSDMGGSLRTPAAFCGVVGFRPSPGIVPRPRRAASWSPLSVEGPMARSVPDAALLLSGMAEYDPLDPLSRPVDPPGFGALPEVDLSTLRVAVSEDLGFTPVAESVRRTFRARCGAFADLFRLSAERDPELDGADRIFAVLRASGFLANPELVRPAEPLAPPVVANLKQAQGFTLAEHAAASAEHGRLFLRFQEFFRDVDLLICPAASVRPFPHTVWAPEEIDGQPMAHYFHWLALAYGITLTTHPVVALPCGVDAGGLPFGIQLVGPLGGDRFLLGAAAALERVFARRPGLGRPVPALDRLVAAAGARPA